MKTTVNVIKGMALGAMATLAIGLVITNKKEIEKSAKKMTENMTDGVSSMFKMN